MECPGGIINIRLTKEKSLVALYRSSPISSA